MSNHSVVENTTYESRVGTFVTKLLSDDHSSDFNFGNLRQKFSHFEGKLFEPDYDLPEFSPALSIMKKESFENVERFLSRRALQDLDQINRNFGQIYSGYEYGFQDNPYLFQGLSYNENCALSTTVSASDEAIMVHRDMGSLFD